MAAFQVAQWASVHSSQAGSLDSLGTSAACYPHNQAGTAEEPSGVAGTAAVGPSGMAGTVQASAVDLQVGTRLALVASGR